MTSIEWTDETWNIWKGCHWVSAGCDNCYMKRFVNPSHVVKRTSAAVWEKPLKMRKPRKIFVCSLSDFFVKEQADQILQLGPQLQNLFGGELLDNLICTFVP